MDGVKLRKICEHMLKHCRVTPPICLQYTRTLKSCLNRSLAFASSVSLQVAVEIRIAFLQVTHLTLTVHTVRYYKVPYWLSVYFRVQT